MISRLFRHKTQPINQISTPGLNSKRSIRDAHTHLAHEVVGEIRRQHLGHELRPKVVGVRGHGRHHPGGDPEAVVHGADRVEQRLLVLLEVLVVGAREALRQPDRWTETRHEERV